jgi:class 3 adenylate cyclase
MSGIRKIAAILVADVVGYSRVASTDEERTLRTTAGSSSALATGSSPNSAAWSMRRVA